MMNDLQLLWQAIAENTGFKTGFQGILKHLHVVQRSDKSETLKGGIII